MLLTVFGITLMNTSRVGGYDVAYNNQHVIKERVVISPVITNYDRSYPTQIIEVPAFRYQYDAQTVLGPEEIRQILKEELEKYRLNTPPTPKAPEQETENDDDGPPMANNALVIRQVESRQ